MSGLHDCTYCDAERWTTASPAGADEGVTCDECGWWACHDCSEGNGWDADDGDGGSWCDECKPSNEE
jgi:hypothetical protein